MRFLLLPLLATCLFADDIVRLDIDKPITTPPPEGEVRDLLREICPSASIRLVKGRLGFLECRLCPSFTSFGREMYGLTVVSVHYGQFSLPGLEQALVGTEGCEPHSSNYGGSLLLTRHNGRWKLNRYLEGGLSRRCTQIRRSDGRDILICAEQDAAQGNWVRMIYLMDVANWTSHTGNPGESVISINDSTATCGVAENSLTPIQKARFQSVEVNRTTGQISASVEYGYLKITREAAETCLARFLKNHSPDPQPSAIPKTRLYSVHFQFNGKRFVPDPTTARALKTISGWHQP